MTTTTTTPRVSIIMAAYNAKSHINQAISSVTNQSFIDFELIIINDGSIDDTEQIIRTHAAADARIRVISQKNQGVVSARNNGLRKAKGEYIAILDSDDEWLPDKLLKQTSYLDENSNTVLVGGGYELMDVNNINIGAERLLSRDEDIRRGMSIYSQFGHSSVMYRHATAKEIGYYPDTCPVEDYDFMRLMMQKGKVYNFPYPLFRYRIATGGISDTNMKQQVSLSKQMSLDIWHSIRPRVYSRQEIIEGCIHYAENPIHSSIGEGMKHLYLFVNTRVGYRMLKNGRKRDGVLQLINIAMASVAGLRIVWGHGVEIIKDTFGGIFHDSKAEKN